MRPLMPGRHLIEIDNFPTQAAPCGRIGLIDFKSSNGLKGPFMGQKVQVAAYANLWNERNPLQELDDCHLLILSKDGAGFKHCTWRKGDLDRESFFIKIVNGKAVVICVPSDTALMSFVV
jgi:hypothetical protein